MVSHGSAAHYFITSPIKPFHWLKEHKHMYIYIDSYLISAHFDF